MMFPEPIYLLADQQQVFLQYIHPILSQKRPSSKLSFFNMPVKSAEVWALGLRKRDFVQRW